ncbi:TRAP dicarboxylate transporter, DctM subunit [Ancylobacter novellus DSM 506]|uniref:TRAP transporter large permease protein n=1 Tax=Ancylobacter novellus (strain ATCC 8093 / DSM 506 / JCM 20403 / CCM 1077 / IAM 12100 / NBRC 12443 / NCIMB 10456) TaxID=639283 RepID=D7A453_ANCN5|nr:TRAP transporter large permease [Ancylobacter novellus]ADH87873.1 TRAP dicarboxylate transporter, DctM subunit [Ancylobacter novellus DSM 506]
MTSGIAITVLFLLLMVASLPVFVAMGIAGFLGFALSKGLDGALYGFTETLWQATHVYELIAIPLFILTGTVMQQSGAGRDLFAVVNAFAGRVRNATGVATILACGIFAAICGSSIATAATVGLVAVPALREQGYGDARAGGFVAAGGTLGILIPPSIPLILYGIITDTSIGQLFIAGVVPGILMMGVFAAYALWSRPQVVVNGSEGGDRWALLRGSVGVLLLPPVIVGAIYLGLFTPTEVGALAVIYVAGLGLLQRRLDGRKLVAAVLAATRTTVMLMMLIVFGQYFAHYLTYEEVPQIIAQSITQVPGGPLVTITLVVLVYLLLGMFLESAAMLLISVPIFFPVAMAIGMDPLTFGIFAIMAMEIAQISPPVGINLFTIHGISRIPLERLALGVLPFIGIQIVFLYLIFFMPEIVLWLPGQMK